MTEGHRFRPEGTEHRAGRVFAISMRAVGSPTVRGRRCRGGCGISPGQNVLTGSGGHSTGLLFSQAGGGALARDRQPLGGAQAPSASW